MKLFALDLGDIGLFRSFGVLDLPGHGLVLALGLIEFGEQLEGLSLQAVGVELFKGVILDLQLVERLLQLDVVFVQCFSGLGLLREPVLQFRCIAALDLLNRNLGLDLGDLFLDLGCNELLAAAVDVVTAEVAVTDMLLVGLDLLPQVVGVLFKMLLNHRGVIISIPGLRSLHLGKARFEFQELQSLLGDYSVVREAYRLRNRLEVDLHTLALVFYNLDHQRFEEIYYGLGSCLRRLRIVPVQGLHDGVDTTIIRGFIERELLRQMV